MFKRLVDFALRRNSREQVLDPIPRTHGYEARPISGYFNNLNERPIFNFYWIERMLEDPRIAFGLAVSNGLEMALEVEVTGPNPRVNDFVKEIWDRIWETSAHQLMRAQCYGYMAYEVMYREERGLVTFDRLIDLYPSDTKPLSVQGQLKAVKVDATRRTLGAGSNNASTPFVLNGMKALWITNDEQFNNRFGRSALLTPYPPWYEKNMKGGTLDMRRLRMVKDAWIGDGVKYPENKVYPVDDGSGGVVSINARDLAMELQLLRVSGGGFVLPSTRDTNGNPEWEYMPPTNVSGVTQILECLQAIDCEIFDGLLLPREIVEAAETGSGFSGRSIPFVAACSIRDVRAMEKVKQVKAQVIDKLVALNFGLDATRDYELTPKPLIESLGKLMGDMGQPNTATPAGTPRPGQPAPPLNGQQQQDDGEDDDQFATAEEEPRTRPRDRRTTRRATDAGSALANDVRYRIDTLLKKKA